LLNQDVVSAESARLPLDSIRDNKFPKAMKTKNESELYRVHLKFLDTIQQWIPHTKHVKRLVPVHVLRQFSRYSLHVRLISVL